MEFLASNSVWVYVLILIGKIIQSIIGVLWLILINRGEKYRAAIVSLVEVSLFLLIVGTVFINFQESILKMAMYVIGTAIGIYIGSVLEERIALGVSSIQVIVAQDNHIHSKQAEDLAEMLRSSGFGVTIMQGKGKKGSRDVLLLHLKRRQIRNALSIIKDNITSGMITVNDVKMIKGGHIKK